LVYSVVDGGVEFVVEDLDGFFFDGSYFEYLSQSLDRLQDLLGGEEGRDLEPTTVVSFKLSTEDKFVCSGALEWSFGDDF